ncbi:SRPBCC family protein [Rheinheimera sp. 4Y26]|uniref:SRPBCC family protein n=1 Tax=Rheinheimera sp. 4Y26 TaxID=2977811 RepID=UPI0021B108F7|nr:SRPBCC family protein [Rheinheimera sp. 4Y26]MCT6699276.1 SRPBCC family protein [Rheinheimera sp. 4Y26]
MSHHTIELHRVLKASPEMVFRAFLAPAALAKWLPPHGYVCTVEHLDAREGGLFKMAFTNFRSGQSHSFGGQYLELKPGELIRYIDKFDDPNLPDPMEVTVTLTAVSCGTELKIRQQGVPQVIPAESCYLGWQDSLAMLALLVEAQLPEQS